MITKYKTGGWGIQIEKVEIVRETEKMVCLPNGRREFKDGFYKYFETFEQAKQYLLDQAERKIESYKDQLQWAHEELIAVHQLKPTP